MEEDRVILALLSEVDLAPGKVPKQREAPAFKFQQLDLQMLPTYGLNTGPSAVVLCQELIPFCSQTGTTWHLIPRAASPGVTGQLLLLCHPMSKGFAVHGKSCLGKMAVSRWGSKTIIFLFQTKFMHV